MRSPSASTPRITRRRLAALLGAAPLAAQVSSPPAAQTSPITANPDAKLQKANESIRDVSARLAKLEVPMDTEPAFVFKP